MFNKGFYKKAKFFKSQNFNQRADKNDFNLVVIHCISLTEGGYANCNFEKFFTNQLDCSLHPSSASLKGVEVSAHF
ncbi:1,6-anhydro-N-acetylmuramyl-L-alanine amidase AmpD, partial [Francisella tularensis subsp. holarctica]|nr:1,6-anhydro-N-acetylmuramyl-L-alanine amidase AmpD [Francisella tularensis subsp. holarctica]